MSQLNFAPAGAITLHYAIDGLTGGTPLVFINSLGTDLRIWDRVVPYFAHRYPLVRYDKRGHGLSDAPPAPYTVADHTDDLAQLLAYLRVEAAILIGVSVGGMIALDYALTYPDQVKGLVVCDTAAKIGEADLWNTRIETIHQNGIESLADAVLERWFSPMFAAQTPAAYRGYFNMLTRTPVAGYNGTCAALRDTDLRDAVGLINVPTLVVCGAEDGATPPELVRGLAESIPGARFALIEKAGHLPSIEQPAALAQEINDFLKGI
ncbi:MAG: 3-oxoadipate enol-lactonase [Anaerolineae bacterium]|nr:3-oxoadipate enol-lactonase [Anaerolineae bacterium]